MEWLLQSHRSIAYHSFIESNFTDIYFTDEENAWIDQTITNIRQINDPYKFAIAFFALCQSCIVKRPYNLFHRKNLYIRLADVKRIFRQQDFVGQAVRRVVPYLRTRSERSRLRQRAAKRCAEYWMPPLLRTSTISSILTLPTYPGKGHPLTITGTDHFLEGLAMYDTWGEMVDYRSKASFG